jgi:hypothetical protein
MAIDTGTAIQIGTMILGLAGIYSQMRSSQAVTIAKLDSVVDRLARIEGKGDAHSSEIADLRTRVSTLGVRVTSLEHGRAPGP